MSDKKLNQIEETLAHQEQQIHDLNDTVTRQWSVIDALEKRLSRLQDKLDVSVEGDRSGESGSLADFVSQNRPPHY